MRIFFDTEFIMRDNGVPELLALGMVKETGETYYVENGDVDVTTADVWVQTHVIPHLTGPIRALPQIAKEVRAFIGPTPELWAYYNTYDHLLLLQLLGGWRNTPEPARVCHDLATILMLGDRIAEQMPKQAGVAHNALADAYWVEATYATLMDRPI